VRIAVVGGTGTVGRRIADALEVKGHEVRALSRTSAHYAVDLRTGEGLQTALEGCHVVVDASNGPPSGKARAVLVEGSRRLLEAEAQAGVGHHVCVSIVGIEDVPMSYYRVKVEQERIVESAQVPWTIVRSTQFHDLLASLLAAAGRWHLLPTAKARLQPVDVAEAAAAVAAVATEPARRGRTTVAGPEIHDLGSLARIWRDASSRRAITVALPLPFALGRALKAGRLTCPDPDVQGTRTFADWLRDK
jgi:uncharacterized protein YbjT (DUF2867 family)